MISQSIIAELYPRAPKEQLAAFANRAGPLFQRFGIDKTTARLEFFLAQLGHESGGLTVIEENLNYRADRICEVWPSRFVDAAAAAFCAGRPEKLANTVYADRMGNGAEASGDGWRYRGRGYIQITGREAYSKLGAIAGLPLEADPNQAVLPENALLVAGAFWQWKDLNSLCDTADFVAVTKRINGATTGIADRRAWLDKVRRTFATPPADADQPAPAVAIAIQQALQAKGYREIGAADGVIGRRTLAAIARFRQENGLGEGGIDKTLTAALGLPAPFSAA